LNCLFRFIQNEEITMKLVLVYMTYQQIVCFKFVNY
jgi:hypothetical protein